MGVGVGVGGDGGMWVWVWVWVCGEMGGCGCGCVGVLGCEELQSGHMSDESPQVTSGRGQSLPQVEGSCAPGAWPLAWMGDL